MWFYMSVSGFIRLHVPSTINVFCCFICMSAVFFAFILHYMIKDGFTRLYIVLQDLLYFLVGVIWPMLDTTAIM